jgi:hypothetical protein
VKIERARLQALGGEGEKQKRKECASSQQLKNAWESRTRKIQGKGDQRQKMENQELSN